ncbi:MAG: UPF0182 family protein [Clostridiales bacterium]
MKVYDYYKEMNKGMSKKNKKHIIITVVSLIVLAIFMYFTSVYMEIIQLDEIGEYSNIYLKNFGFKAIFFVITFVIIFFVFKISNKITLNKCIKYHNDAKHPMMKLQYTLVIIVIALLGGFIAKDVFYLKFLEFLNSTSFGTSDPVFGSDVSYYIFQRPFLMSIYRFVSFLWFCVICFTLANYFIIIMPIDNTVLLKDSRLKPILNHNLINISIFFIIKVFSYRFQKEEILYSTRDGIDGASYVQASVWLKYYNIAPFLLIIIVLAAFIFLKKNKLKQALTSIVAFPVVWIVVLIIATVIQNLFVAPNAYKYEKKYLKNNMEMTRKAYNIDSVGGHTFEDIEPLTKKIMNENSNTKENIRIVDLEATIDSNKQLQSLTPFYNFNDGDILSYNFDGKEIPVLISAREIDTKKIQDKTYLNKMFRYTHGYGVVINPINKVTKQGQTEFIMSGLNNKTSDGSLKVKLPQIYYGELTNNYVVVNEKDSSKLTEIDETGTKEVNYEGKGGIELNLFKRLLFSIKNRDGKLLISSNIDSNSRLLINRNIVERVKRAVPFITVDDNAYIVLTKDGRLKWVLDGYTTSSNFPNAQFYGNVNYIRNSLKIVVDAYDGQVEYYVIDKDDPVIKTYSKIYKDVFKYDGLPEDIKEHIRYPEELFNIQSEMIEKYHLDPSKEENVRAFDGKQNFWNIATIQNKDTKQEEVLEPFYNMINLPGKYSKNEELILMRPYTPIGEKHNLVSWLAVRNSYEDYGKLILFNFSNSSNVFGPYQIEDKINQIDSISKDMTLWGTSGSEVFKGNLLVIPIENSLLYVEPIYIKSSSKSIPEVRLIVAGYQDGNEFKYGIGTDLDLAINDLFGITESEDKTKTGETNNKDDEKEEDKDKEKIDEIKEKYDDIKKQLDELGKILEEEEAE